MKFYGLVFGVIAFFLSGCAPSYETVNDYIPPETAQGKACTQRCSVKQQQCHNNCQVKYQRCSMEAEQQAKKELPDLLIDYEKKLETWEEAERDYQHELWLYERERRLLETEYYLHDKRCRLDPNDAISCHRSRTMHPNLWALDPPDRISPAPKRPSIASEAKRIRKANCSQDCQCEQQYGLCYSGCGGVVKTRKVCVKNCNRS